MRPSNKTYAPVTQRSETGEGSHANTQPGSVASAPYQEDKGCSDCVKSNKGLLCLILLLIITAAVIVPIIIIYVGSDTSENNNNKHTDRSNNNNTNDNVNSGTINIVIQSANTKEKWMETMVSNFMNNKSVSTLNGKKIKITLHNTGSTFKQEYKPDVWSPANAQFIRLQSQHDNVNYVSDETALCTPVTNIPVGVCMWRRMAEELGWPDEDISFRTLGELAIDPNGWESITGSDYWGDFKYGHGHPDESNSGRLSFLSTIFAFSNSTSADEKLTLQDVYAAANDSGVIAVEQSVYHLGKIDTDLLARMLENGPTYLHAVANYESNVINWNIDYATEMAKHDDTWVFIYLSDGTFWMTHPLCALDGASWNTQEKVNASQQFIKYATSQYNLEKLLQYGIRPSTTTYGTNDIDITCCDSTILNKYGVDPNQSIETIPLISYPDDDVMTAAIKVWHSIKKTAAFALVIDDSGSMSSVDSGYTSSRLSYAKDAIIDFINSTDEQDYLMAMTFRKTYNNPGYVRDIKNDLISWIDAITASGGTPLYDTIDTALDTLISLKLENEENLYINNSLIEINNWNYAIVTMTDGAAGDGSLFNTVCQSFAIESDVSTNVCSTKDISEDYADSPDIIHLFPIIFGDEANAETENLDLIAQITTGKLYEADNDDLTDVYYQISLEL